MARTKDQVKRKRCLELTLQGEMSTAQIAAELRVNEQTIRRWRREPEFDEAVNEAHAEASAQAYSLLSSAQVEIIMALKRLVLSEDGANANAKAKAALQWFELMGRHKNSPIKRPEIIQDELTQEQLIESMSQEYSPELLREVLARADARREVEPSERDTATPRQRDI